MDCRRSNNDYNEKGFLFQEGELKEGSKRRMENFTMTMAA